MRDDAVQVFAQVFASLGKTVDNSTCLNNYSSLFRILWTGIDDKETAASNMEMTAVMKTVRLGASACVAALALALTCGVASAQLQKAPETKKAEPATKADPAKKAEPAAKSGEAKKAPAKVVCAGTPDETACTAKGAECQWIAAAKTKAGADIKAYCRTAPKIKAKAPEKKAEPAKSSAPAADKAPAKSTAPAAKAPAPAPKN